MGKAFIALTLTLSAWGVGLNREWLCRARIRRLSAFCDGLLLMEQEIGTCLLPLRDAFASAGRYDALFTDAALLLSDLPPEEAFVKALGQAALGKEETEIFSSFAKGLGAPAEDAIRQNISLCRKRLEDLLHRAENNALRLGRLYSVGGAICGLFISILLL